MDGDPRALLMELRGFARHLPAARTERQIEEAAEALQRLLSRLEQSTLRFIDPGNGGNACPRNDPSCPLYR